MAISCASVELPPLPNASSRPPTENRPGHVLGAGAQPGGVAGADLAPQGGDLGGLGHGGPPDLLHHRVQVALARVEERVQRLHRGRRWRCRRAAGLRALRGHDVTTAIASPACTRMVSPGRGRHERDADLFLAGAGVDQGQVVAEQPHHGHRDGGVGAGHAHVVVALGDRGPGRAVGTPGR